MCSVLSVSPTLAAPASYMVPNAADHLMAQPMRRSVAMGCHAAWPPIW